MRLGLVALLFWSAWTIGYAVSTQSWDGRLFVYLGGEDRSPAAMRMIRDYSELDRRALTRSVQSQLMHAADVVQSPDGIGLRMGHPILREASGEMEFACRVPSGRGAYDKIEVTFIGGGVAASGHLPEMRVEGDCRASADINALDTIWLPMQAILTAPPKDQEMQVLGDAPVIVRLEHIPDEWPNAWTLHSVRLFRADDPQDEMVIDAASLREVRPKLLTFDWQNR